MAFLKADKSMVKYKLTEETIRFLGHTLYRIEAVRDFADVKKGDKGGFIEKKKNLSHKGDAWVYDDAMVFEHASVGDSAKVCGHAEVFGSAKIFGDALVGGEAKVWGYTLIHGNAEVEGDTWVWGNTELS